jgi:endonuclease/exonuclease/phosphatase family metal-dependent hydrolase
LDLVGIFCLIAQDARADQPVRLRVLSYNIHHGEGIDGKLDLKRITQVIQSVAPDVVALQEVGRKTERTGRVDQPNELARLSGMKVVFEKNIDFQGGQYGNAILSKLPIVHHRNLLLPCFDEGEQRGVLIAELRVEAAGGPVLFLATHLDHRRDDSERFASAQRINELIQADLKMPAILAGDLNATVESRVLGKFAELWCVSNTDELATVPVSEPKRQIDFILFRPGIRWRVAEVRVLTEAVASDHRAIFAVLELLPPRVAGTLPVPSADK